MNRPLPLFIPVLSFLSPSSSSASPPRLPSPCLPLLPLPLPLFPIPLPIFRPATPGTNSHYEKPRQSKSLRQAPAKQKERGLPRDSPLQMRINLCYLKIFLPTPSPDPLPGSRSEIQARIRCPDRGRKSKPGSIARLCRASCAAPGWRGSLSSGESPLDPDVITSRGSASGWDSDGAAPEEADRDNPWR